MFSDLHANRFSYLRHDTSGLGANVTFLIDPEIDGDHTLPGHGVANIGDEFLCCEPRLLHLSVGLGVDPWRIEVEKRLVLQSAPRARFDPPCGSRTLRLAHLSRPILLPFRADWEDPEVECCQPVGIAFFAGLEYQILANIGALL